MVFDRDFFAEFRQSCKTHFFPAIAVILALAVNVQFTIGARIAASDIVVGSLLPFLVLTVRGFRLHPWVILLGFYTLVLSASFLNGPMDKWAMTKSAGWFVLLCYGAVGILLADYYRLFSRIYVVTLCVLVFAFIGVSAAGMDWSGIRNPRFSALIGNANAASLALLCGVIVARDAFERWEIPAAILVAGVIFSWSVAGMIALAVVALVWLVRTRCFVSLARIILIALPVYLSPLALDSLLSALPETQTELKGSRVTTGALLKFIMPDAADSKAIEDHFVHARMKSNAQAVELWQTSPILGTGLGSYWEKYRSDGMIIHSTPLWILTEMGLTGLLTFIALVGSFGWFLYRGGAHTGLMILIGWAVMAIPHELLYQRIPWLLLGFLLAAAGSARGARREDPVLTSADRHIRASG